MCELLGSVPTEAYPDEAGKRIPALNKYIMENIARYCSCLVVLCLVVIIFACCHISSNDLSEFSS